MNILEQLSAAGFPDAELVGSRVTCNPAPTDTDQDVLVLIPRGEFGAMLEWVTPQGYSIDGSEVEDHFGKSPKDSFQSLSKGDINIICTEDIEFFEKFMLATHVAKTLNVLEKAHRIVLFQAILYGNEVR